MHFARFDPDAKSRCIFSAIDDEVEDLQCNDTSVMLDRYVHEANAKSKYSALKRQLEYYLVGDEYEGEVTSGFFAFPAHTIRVKGVVNDTELPSVRVNYDEKELSF